MLTILVLTIVFILGSACISWVLYEAIQEGEALGRWQLVLNWLYRNEHDLLEKWLGGCYKCFSHFIGMIVYFIYMIVQYRLCWAGWWNILIYLIFVPASIVLAQFVFTTIEKRNLEIKHLKDEPIQIREDLTSLLERVNDLEDEVEQLMPKLK